MEHRHLIAPCDAREIARLSGRQCRYDVKICSVWRVAALASGLASAEILDESSARDTQSTAAGRN